MARELINSGIRWLGDIPCNWNVTRFRYCFTTGSGLNITKADLVDEGTAVISYGQVHAKYNSRTHLTDDLLRYIPKSLTLGKGGCKLHRNDFVFADTSEDYEGCGNAVFIDSDREVYAGYHTIIARPKIDGDLRFLAYLFTTQQWRSQIQEIVSGVKVNSITRAILNDCVVILPPIKDQKNIANYLDYKCSEIDALIADLNEQIKKLTEYKRSIISETVIHGLNSNAATKDSGIAWVGNIPSHWNIHPVYSYFSQRNHKNIHGAEQNLLSLSYGKIVAKDINMLGGLLPASFNTYNIVEDGDIIIRPTDLQNDKRSLRTGLATEHGIITSAYIALKPNANVNSKYFHYLLHSYDVKKVFYNMGNGVRQGLNYSEFSRLLLVEPPYKEQCAIAEYLDVKIKEIEELISDKQLQISHIKEYRASLIYEYVTGKKQVNL